MKTILIFAGLIALFATTGCLVTEGGRHGHAHDAIIVGPPPLIVHPPVVIVRPPEIIVR